MQAVMESNPASLPTVAGSKPRATAKRLRFFGGGTFSKQSKAAAQEMVVTTSPNPEEAEALRSLERMLADRILRNKFIAHMAKLVVTPNLCSLVRFCAAVDEYASAKDKTEKKSKGRKINAMFLQSGAMFELPSSALPAELVNSLLAERFDGLLVGRNILMAQLIRDEHILQALKDVE